MHQRFARILWPLVFLVLIWLSLSTFLFFRWDLTKEKRYTLSANTKEMLASLQEPIEVKLYLNGPLDANMATLRNAFKELIDEYNIYVHQHISLVEINPSEAKDEKKRDQTYMKLEKEGLTGMSVSIKDDDGRYSQQIVFPWAVFSSGKRSTAIALMQPSINNGAEQSIQAAIEDLEYQMTDALRIITRKEVTKIAYIEGHGELDEWETYDVNEAFSRYFQVDRGQIGNDPTVLTPYKAIIIAAPQEPFTEAEKYVLDYYVMHGGRILWLIDGVKISEDELSKSGNTPTIPLDVNLNDMLFKYGVRVTSTIVSDLQCTYMPMNIAKIGENPRFEPMPYFYAPLLQGSPYHPITKNIMPVKANYPSAIELTSNDPLIHKELLLITSNASHVTSAPNNIMLDEVLNLKPEEYFNTGHIPIAVIMEGEFPSLFAHRMTPKEIVEQKTEAPREFSPTTRMVVVADGDIIKNEFEREKEGYRILPVGFDRMSQQTFGNKDFALNTLLYLTDTEGLMELRNRQMPLRLLNKAVVTSSRKSWQWICVVGPLALLALFALAFFLFRIKKYKK